MPKSKRRPRTAPGARGSQPSIRHSPGLAQRTLAELAPYLAEEGIDLAHADLTFEELQAALDRAAAKRNHALFTPEGTARDLAVELIRDAVAALVGRRPRAAAEILDSAVPESVDGSTAEASACIGVALRLLDSFAVADLEVASPPVRWPAPAVAYVLIKMARRGLAFAALGDLIATFGGRPVLDGSASALAVVIRARSLATDTPAAELIALHIR